MNICVNEVAVKTNQTMISKDQSWKSATHDFTSDQLMIKNKKNNNFINILMVTNQVLIKYQVLQNYIIRYKGYDSIFNCMLRCDSNIYENKYIIL